MFLLNWYKEFLDIKIMLAEKKRELQYCEACETLKLQLAVANEERKFLIQKLTKEPEVKEEVPASTEFKPILPSRHLMFSQKRRHLEEESRANAAALRRKEQEMKEAKKGTSLTVNEIEKELGVENG